MTEMKSDVEWVDTYLRVHHPQYLLASRVPRVSDPLLIKAWLLSAVCALVVVHSSWVGTGVVGWWTDVFRRTLDTYHSKGMCVDLHS
jgi:hypothetical protein